MAIIIRNFKAKYDYLKLNIKNEANMYITITVSIVVKSVRLGFAAFLGFSFFPKNPIFKQ